MLHRADATVRVAGVVANDSITRDNAHQIIHFTIKDGGGTLPVVYGGVVPDVFKPGIQVVVEGHLTNGVFQASAAGQVSLQVPVRHALGGVSVQ